jgi:DNA-binding response OmpR family regulator
MLTQLFRDEGFETLAAENGAHALSVASARQPDVIVLDMGLPVLDASGFALEWKQRKNATEIPVVAISGQPFGEAMAREIGAVVFYEKPLDLSRLAGSVRDLAARHAGERQRDD